MGWSYTAPTLPSGVSWSSESATRSHSGSWFRTSFHVATARGIGDTYYIRFTYTVSNGDRGLDSIIYFNVEGEPSYSRSYGTWSGETDAKIYYTGTLSGSASLLCSVDNTATVSSSGSAPAVISAPILWTVSYNGNGNTGGSTASQTKQSGVALTIAQNGFTRDKYVFVEWNTASDGTGTSYAPGASYTANAALTLYAIWKKANIPVYANDNGTIRQIEKAYVNVGGVIKEATVYVNVGGVIKELV